MNCIELIWAEAMTQILLLGNYLMTASKYLANVLKNNSQKLDCFRDLTKKAGQTTPSIQIGHVIPMTFFQKTL